MTSLPLRLSKATNCYRFWLDTILWCQCGLTSWNWISPYQIFVFVRFWSYGLQHCVVLHMDTRLAGCAKTQTVSRQSLTTEAGFNPRLIHVGLVVDKVANNKGILQVIQFSFIRIISPIIHPSWMLNNLDIFRIIYKHTHTHFTSGVARKVTNHNCRRG